jgi:hypothetical protein
MMYGNKLAAAIKVNGKVLREFKDTAYIPFGSEYTILIKNLNTVRALVNIYIDGDNVVPGGLVLNPGQEVDLERSVKNGNLNSGNKFKFIERTGAVEEHRGVKLEDGLIRIEHQFEIPRPVINVAPVWNTHKNTTGDYVYPAGMTSEYPGVVDKYSNSKTTGGWIQASGATLSQVNVNGALRGVDYSANGGATAQAASSAIDKYCADNGILTNEFHSGSATMDWCDNEVGITVPGSKSEQKFQTTYMGALDPQVHNMVIRLLGETPNNKPVEKPVTVKSKQKCDTCGHLNRATANFCTKCGTSLKLFA